MTQEKVFDISDAQLEHRKEDLRQQLAQLQQTKISLKTIMPVFAEFGCKPLRHKDHEQIDAEMMRICRQYNMWNEKTGDNYNSMTACIIPNGHPKRVEVISLCFALNWYWDDASGDDIMNRLTEEEKVEAKLNVKGMQHLLMTGKFGRETPSDCERAFEYLLSQLQMMSPPSWMSRFRRGLKEHMEQGYEERSPRSVVSIGSWEKFVDIRRAHSAMDPTTFNVEFCCQAFSHPTIFKFLGLAADYEEVRSHLTILGGISNDVISFEKEFIDEGMWFGAVQYLFLTRPEMTLEDVLVEIGKVIDHSTQRICLLLKHFRTTIQLSDIPEKQEMLDYCQGLEDLAISCYGWQLATKRYKRIDSMFYELNLAADEPTHRLV